MNILGVLTVVFGALVLFIATQPSWKRPIDQMLPSMHTNIIGEDNTKVDQALSQLSRETDAEACGDVRRRSNKLEEQDN